METLALDRNNETIGIVGAGYVGLVSGACFSFLGFDVGIVEIDAHKVAKLKLGESTLYEPGLSEILSESIQNERLSFYQDTTTLFAQKKCDIVFIAVGTPERPDGSCNLDYVFGAVKDVVSAAQNELVIVIKSTVPVGTSEKVKAFIRDLKPRHRIGVVNNPEFLKEGSAVSDFLKPERVVIGGSEAWAVDKVKSLYESLLHNGHPLFVTDHESAELGKLAANLMLASRISLINQVSRLATATGANIKHIESILRTDSRIGSKYLYAGLGYGGSCFPKDVKNFINLCKEFDVDASMAEVVDSFNDRQKLFFISDIERRFATMLQQKKSPTIALLGVAFKPETDDIRESPALTITEELSRRNFKIKAYDPKALGHYGTWIKENKISNVELCVSAAEALSGADAMILVTEWQEFQRLGAGKLAHFFKGQVVYDGKNVLNPARVTQMGLDYLGVGRSFMKESSK